MSKDLPIKSVVQGGAGWVIVKDSSGATVKRTGPRNWRNNNPGNLINPAGSPGMVGRDKYGDPVFDTYEHGLQAQQNLLFGPKSKYRGLTLKEALYRYTPPVVEQATGQKGNPDAYLRTIIAAVPGLTLTTPWSSLTASQQQGVIQTMHKVEGFKPGTIEIMQPGTGNASPDTTTVPSQKPGEDAKPKVKEEAVKLKPIPNRLKQYASYTYGLSLHLMSQDEYNKCVLTQSYKPTNVLVASAGRHNPSTFRRNKFFTDDFYFDDFEVVTVISPNDTSKNTNALDISFTLLEPYGFTFMERLLKAAEEIKSENYLDMPYMVQIDFFAIDDAGNILGSVEELKKLFPIKLNKMDVKVGVKGAEYRFQATPYGHSALDGTSITTPANFEVTAGSVSEFFQSIEGSDADTFIQAKNAATATQRDESAAANSNKISPIVRNALPGTNPLDQWKPVQKAIPSVSPAAVPSKQPTAKIARTTKSYGSAINDYYKALKNDNKIGVADVYRFEFLPDSETGQDIIGPALFTDRLRSTPKETPMLTSSELDNIVTMRKADLGSSQNVYDTSKAVFQINYGTTIEKLLEYIIRNSNYIQDQLVVPDGMSKEEYQSKKEALKDKPLNWFRIVPTVRLLEFDNIRKIWAREITYSVQPYKLYNIRSDVGPQGVATNPVKEYNYIYTGKNDDVFDFDIAFNALYYNQTTAYRDNLAETSPTAASATENYESQNAPNYTGGDPPKGTDFNAVMPLVMKPVIQNSKAVATGGATTAKETAAADLADSIMSSSDADMINLKLKILGDPDFIKQDDSFYSPVAATKDTTLTSDPRLINSGSIATDDGGVYAQVAFRTPVDIDESTGLMDFNGYAKHSVFSGMYLVLQVRSIFSQGQFTQELDLVRCSRQQAFDYVSGQNDKSTERSIPGALPGVMGVDSPPPTTGPSTEVTGGSGPPSSADAADSTTNQSAGSTQQVAQIQNTEEPVVKPDQAALMNAARNAETTPITAQNEPSTSAPPQNPSEAKKAAESALATARQNPDPGYLAYSSAQQQLSSIQDSIDMRTKNIERTNLRLARADLTEEERVRFTQLKQENESRLDALRAEAEPFKAELSANKQAYDTYSSKLKELQNNVSTTR